MLELVSAGAVAPPAALGSAGAGADGVAAPPAAGAAGAGSEEHPTRAPSKTAPIKRADQFFIRAWCFR